MKRHVPKRIMISKPTKKEHTLIRAVFPKVANQVDLQRVNGHCVALGIVSNHNSSMGCLRLVGSLKL